MLKTMNLGYEACHYLSLLYVDSKVLPKSFHCSRDFDYVSHIK